MPSHIACIDSLLHINHQSLSDIYDSEQSLLRSAAISVLFLVLILGSYVVLFLLFLVFYLEAMACERP